MIESIKEIYAYRDLLYMMTVRDLKVRYKQAAMGFLWALFMPMVAVAAGVLIKKAMAVVAQQAYDVRGLISITIKVLPWTFFVSSIRFSVQALVGNTALVTKIYFPRAILVLSAILACLFDFGIATVVLVALLVFFKVGVSIHLLWLPLYLILLFLYTAGVGMILASANLFYRDVKYIVEVILMFGIFFTPVFYEASAFGRWEAIMLINPIGSLLEGINQVVVYHEAPDALWATYSIVSSIGTFLFGSWIFHKTEPLFAENI
jgi:lipopolysaccharide transport system permease protein